MQNIIKIHAWAEPYVNFLLGETSPLKEHSVSSHTSDLWLYYLHYDFQKDIIERV